MPLAILLSAPSTYEIATGQATYYGMLADRSSGATGGTVVIADLTAAGHNPDIHAMTGAFVSVSYASTTAPMPVVTDSRGVSVRDGLTVAFTSTRNVTIYYDD